MRGVLSRLGGADLAAAGYAAAFFAWLALRTPGTPTTELIGAAAFYPLGLAVAWACWRAATVPGLDGRTRAGWYLLALSALLLHASGFAWELYLRFFDLRTWPAWVDYLESGHSLVIVAAILVLPGRRFAGRSRTRFLIEAALTVVAGCVLAVYFDLRLWFSALKGERLDTLLFGPGIDWAVFVAAAIGAAQKKDRGTRSALVCMVLAVVAYIAANYYYTIAMYGPTGSTYRTGDSVDGLWFAAWVLRWIAARLARDRYERDRGLQAADQAAAGRYERSVLSYLVVASAFVVLAGQVFSGEERFLGVLAGCVALMIALLLARQIVELRENERLFAARLEQETRFRSFVQHSSDVVLVVDAAGMIAYASPTAARVLGEGSPVRVGARLVDLLREDERAVVASMVAGSAGPRQLRFRLPADGGRWRDIEAVWNDLRHDPGVGGIVVNCRDVTERNELEGQLRHGQKLDAVGHLAGGLAHDLNNVLTIIGGYAELLGAELAPGSAAADDLAHVRQAVDRAAAVTRKVLAFSRRQPVLRAPLDLNVLVRDMVPLLRQSVGAKVQISLVLSDRPWAVQADRGQLEQVLVNLAANAGDAMASGGVLTIETANRSIDGVSADGGGLPPGDYVSMVVSDTGAGMSPEVLDRIFEPFFSTKAAGEGAGLGLAMVQGIVLETGGRVLVESAVGGGSRFTILLPRTDAPVAAHEDPGESSARPPAPCTVLVVDDEDEVRAVARRMLERDGYRVVEAASGSEALTLVDDPSVHLDLLLTDLIMPGITGRQVIARCGERRPTLPIVCMTGFAGEGDDPNRFGDNLVALLSKPFSPQALGRAVGAAVGRRSST